MSEIGRYQVLAEVAQGGSGTVFKGRAPDGTPVAVKLLQAGRAPRRFAQEVQALLRIRHEHLVTLLDAGTHQGAPYLVLEWIEGETLEARLERAGPLDPREAAEVVRRLALALEHCHAQGILHRDLKPANVLIRAGSGAPLLTDFGLARDLDASVSGATLTGQFMGTPGWWPPEQARGDKERIGPRSDVYGLGGLLYSALTALPPHAGTSLQELLQPTPPPAPGTRRPGVPAWLDAACMRALATDPEHRPASAGELARALEWPSAGPGVRGPQVAIAALGAVLLTVAGLLAWLLLEGRDAPIPAIVGPPPQDAPRRTYLHPRGEWTRPSAHSGFVYFLAASPGGRWAISTGQGNCVLAWDLSGPAPWLRTVWMPVETHTTGVAFDPRRPERAWIAGTDKRVRALELPSGSWAAELDPLPAHAWMLGFFPTGELVAAGTDGALRAWAPDGPSGAPRELCPPTTRCYSWDRAPDGRLLTSGDDGVQLLERNGAVASLEAGLVSQAVFTPDGRVALAGVAGLQTWDPQSGSSRRLLNGVRVNALAWSSDRRSLFSGGWDGAVHAWEPDLSASRRLPLDLGQGVNALAATPDGRLLLVGGVEGRVAAFELATGRRLESRQAHTGPVRALKLLAGGSVVSVGEDGGAVTWDPERGTPSEEGRFDRPLAGVGHLGDGSRTYLALDRTLVLAGSPSFPSTTWPRQVTALAVSPVRGRLAALEVEGGQLIILEPGATEPASILPAPEEGWSAVAWRGEELLVGTTRGRVARLAQEIRFTTPASGAVIALAPAGDGLVALTADELAWEDGPTREATHLSAPPIGLAVDATSRRAVTISSDGQLAVRALAPSLPLLETLPFPADDAPSSLLFAGTGDLLVGTTGGRILRYRVD